MSQVARFRAGPLTLSGLEARPDGPAKGVVLALHGGGYLAGYWDYPGASLLQMAAARGFQAVAVDRPGYGVSADRCCGIPDQVERLLDLVEALAEQAGGAPVFLAGHSLGGILALLMASGPRSGRLAAVDVCGVPLEFTPAMGQGLAARRPAPGQTHDTSTAPEHRRALFFGPDDSFDPGVLDFDAEIAAPPPTVEITDATATPDFLPPAMRKITLPVRFTFSELEACSLVVPARARELLAASRGAEVRIEPGVGHNISLHKRAATFHAEMLDFFERFTAS
jgi:pimeloyl-ACP methyl ester carboxylesterase